MRELEVIRKNPFILVLISLILFLLLSSFLNMLLLSIVFTATLLTGIYATFEGKPKLNFGLVAGVLAILMTWGISFESVDLTLNVVRFIFFFAFVSYVCHRIMRKVIFSSVIDFNIIAGAVSVYILLALLFSFVFSLIYVIDPASFRFPNTHESAVDFVYFSYVTITTLGYGEITPASPLARSLAIVLALIGQLYLTILVAILVSKFKGWRDLQREEGDEASSKKEE